MRFFAAGPNIPDDLLEQRDRGNVVFFCGAGVSVPSGLPGFSQLTKRTIRALGTPADAKSRRLFERPRVPGEDPPFDQVFNLLQQEYRRTEVDDVVSQLLKTPRRASVETHKIILRLSRNARKLPQVVSTNFDLLFERADKTLQIHVPPALPDLAIVGSFDGIIYLHGRRGAKPSAAAYRQHLILSSSDFGRAYLADGWATRFVRDLLQTYVIVLVGYSASDPPVRYLLEGLHARDSKKAASIYAFDQGEPGADDLVRDRWRSLGVVAIPYTRTDSRHAGLWNTLGAWANRADNPEAWRRSIVGLAQTNPKSLEPFQRGQVADLVRTTQGAALFASATPPPPAEWLCVFDRLVRYAAPTNTFSGGEPDPLAMYGLDEDPPRPKDPAAMNVSNDLVEDLISLLPHDERTDRHKRLAGTSMAGSDPLPARLGHLAYWLTRVASDPIAMWWAAGYETLHPRLLAGIQRDLRASQTAPQDFMRRVWRMLLERFQHSPEERHAWYHFLPRQKSEGWTPGVLREFERVVQPHLAVKRPSPHRVSPPQFDDAVPMVRKVVDFEIAFPGRGQEQLEIPTPTLPAVFEIVRRALHRGASLLVDIEAEYWRTASFHATEGAGKRYLNDASRYLHWIRALFDRLCSEHPAVARREVRGWPADDPYFFTKLTIYAWMNPALIPGDETAVGILSLSDSGFWEHDHRRELLHTLRSRWKDFGRTNREQIEGRILAGPRLRNIRAGPCPRYQSKLARTGTRSSSGRGF
jgi:hypothetical protein